MSYVSLIDLLQNGTYEFSNKVKNGRTITENIRNEVSVSYSPNMLKSSFTMKTKSSFVCSGVKNQYDIDINYAINLLKKEDQNKNVYVLSVYCFFTEFHCKHGIFK